MPAPSDCWETHSDPDLRRSAKETVAMDHVFVSIVHRDRQNVSGNPGCEGEFSRCSVGAILGHEQGSAARHPPDCAEKTAGARHLRMRRHLNGGAHPGKLTGLGDYGFIRLKNEFEHRHGGANNIALHEGPPRNVTSKCSTRERGRTESRCGHKRGASEGGAGIRARRMVAIRYCVVKTACSSSDLKYDGFNLVAK